MAHTHHFTARRPNATVLVCDCGRIQHVVSEENPAIAGIPDTSHLDAILQRLDHERERWLNSRGKEREYREVQIAQINKELEAECKFLGYDWYLKPDAEIDNMTDNELMEALNG